MNALPANTDPSARMYETSSTGFSTAASSTMASPGSAAIPAATSTSWPQYVGIVPHPDVYLSDFRISIGSGICRIQQGHGIHRCIPGFHDHGDHFIG
jgi:hypothetical protein